MVLLFKFHKESHFTRNCHCLKWLNWSCMIPALSFFLLLPSSLIPLLLAWFSFISWLISSVPCSFYSNYYWLSVQFLLFTLPLSSYILLWRYHPRLCCSGLQLVQHFQLDFVWSVHYKHFILFLAVILLDIWMLRTSN